MSLDKYLVKLPGLPNPRDKKLAKEGIDPAMVRAANDEIAKVLSPQDASDRGESSSGGARKKRGSYGFYTPEQRAKIGRYAAENGVNVAARKFTKDLGRKVNESTVRGMKDSYLKELHTRANVECLPKQQRGRPLLLGKEADMKVQAFIRAVRDSGGPISTTLVLASAKGLFKKANPPILIEYGGHLKLEKSWARSILQRMNFTKRKGTKAARHRPEDFEIIQGKFHRRIARRVKKYKIPDALVINWDQTGVEVIPSGKWTMNQKGDKQVEIKGIDDKRQYTALLACTLSGELLPPQILYQGTTDRCHPHADFP